MDSEFVQLQITTITAQITLYQSVLTELANSPNKAYTFNTGQTQQSVTQKDAGAIRDLIRGLVGDLQYWESLSENTGAIAMRPAF